MARGKIFIPIDLRNLAKNKEPFVVALDEEEDQLCARMDIFSEAPDVHVQLKLDEHALYLLFDKLLANRLELLRKLSFQRGAAHGARKKN